MAVIVPVKADNHELIRRDVLASKVQHLIFYFASNTQYAQLAFYDSHLTWSPKKGTRVETLRYSSLRVIIKTETNHNFRVEQNQFGS